VLLGSRFFMRYALYSAFLFAAYYAFVSGSPIIMIGVWQHSPESFAIWWVMGSASYILGNYLAGRLSRALGADRMIAIGTRLALAGGGLLLLLASAGIVHPLSIFAPIGIVFVGNGIAQPSALSRAMDFDAALVGSGAACVGCMQIAFGVATITLLGALPSVSFLSFSSVCAAAIALATVSYVALGGPLRS
jgi:DHA1 family bicyclomycin/chloramphenicol resistance-like MFS transporter